MSFTGKERKLDINQYNVLQGAIADTVVTARDLGITTLLIDDERPWGGFVQFRAEDFSRFKERYFPNTAIPANGRCFPKILIVLKGQKTSVQYHHNREECWVKVDGELGVHLSPDPRKKEGEKEEGPWEYKRFEDGRVIWVPRHWRHTMQGEAPVSRIAEIWHEPDPNNPTDEITDNYRIFDFYGRPNEGAAQPR